MPITQEPATVTTLNAGFILVLPNGLAYADPESDGDTPAVYVTEAEATEAARELTTEARDFFRVELDVAVVPRRGYLTGALTFRPVPALTPADTAGLAARYPAHPDRTTYEFAVLLPGGALYSDAETLADPGSGRKFTSYREREDAETRARDLNNRAVELGITGYTARVVVRRTVTHVTDWA